MKKDYQLYLLDMDGTLYLDHTLFEGSIEFLNQVKAQGNKYLFLTNNSSKSVQDYIRKLKTMGIDSTLDDFYTSSMASAYYLKKHHKNQVVYVAGTKSLIEELVREGIEVRVSLSDDIQVILLGYDTELTYRKLEELSLLLTKTDLPYLATNPDIVCPTSFGFVPDCGSMADMLYNATGKRPYFIGKPNPLMIELAIKKAVIPKKNTLLIGDRIYTDIQSGINAKIDTALVLSGETTKEVLEQSIVKPTYVFDSIHAILKSL